MKFTYAGYDEKGRASTGMIDATNALEASDLLAQRGVFVDRVDAARAETGGSPERQSARGAKLFGPSRARLVAGFSRDLAVLIETGTPLADAAHAIERQCQDDAFRRVIADVCCRLEEGSMFAEALEAHPRYFDAVYRSMVSAGECGGGMAPMLARLADLTRRELAIRQQLVGSLSYPFALLVISGGVLAAMFVFVLPRFSGMFETLNAPLPASTEMMLSVSHVIRGYWWAMLAGLAVGVPAAAVYVRSPKGHEALTRLGLRLPVIGKLMRDFTLARIARVLGTLLGASVPFLDALQLTKAGVSNPAYVRLLTAAETSVTDGEPVSSPFARSPLISPQFSEAMRSGEQSGRLAPVLTALASHLDEDNEVRLRAVTKIVEPTILAILGVMVGVVAISLFLPLFDLTSMAGGG